MEENDDIGKGDKRDLFKERAQIQMEFLDKNKVEHSAMVTGCFMELFMRKE